MKNIIKLLDAHPQVSGYKINIREKESCELFFVKGSLETVRRTDTCDKEVTVYVDHDGFKGDSQFLVYPSTTEEAAAGLIDEAVKKALLINNENYSLPPASCGEYQVESNFSEYEALELASMVADAVFAGNTVEHGSLNSVEIFINKRITTVMNSSGLCKKQLKYDAMVEAIPTFNGTQQSVELYEQHNFSSFDPEQITAEISGKMAEVKARYEAVKPDFAIDCPVIISRGELSELFRSIAYDLNYASVYSRSNLFKKGDALQSEPSGDLISFGMRGQTEGSSASAMFDADGLDLGSIALVEGGKVVNYYGSNRHGQYLGEKPTGSLPCVWVEPGTLPEVDFERGPYLEVLSMSGLQVDFYSDYIGGEVRLARLSDGENILPVTGISISGSLSRVLSSIRLCDSCALHGSYHGPKKAMLQGMKIF